MNELFPEPEPKFIAGDNKEYKVKAIIDSAIYAKEAKRHLSGLYYLIFQKSYSKKKHLGAILYSHISSENNLHFPQRSPKETNGNLFFPRLRSAHDQAVSQIRQFLCKTKARPPNKLNKISQRMKYWVIRFFFPCLS